MEFKKKQIADRFAMAGDDQHIEIPGRHKGLLSEVQHPSIIEGMIKRGSNLVSEKMPAAKNPQTQQTPKP